MIKNYIFSLKKSLILSKIAKKKKDINYKKIIITRFASLILLIFISCKDNSSNLEKTVKMTTIFRFKMTTIFGAK